MSFRYSVSQEEKTAVVIADGKINFQDSIAAVRSVALDPEFEPEYTVIVDLRDMDYLPSMSEIFGIRDVIIGMREQYKGKVIIAVKEARLQVARLASLLASAMGFEMSVVTDIDLPRVNNLRDVNKSSNSGL